MTEGYASGVPSLNEIFDAVRWVAVAQHESDGRVIDALLRSPEGVPVELWDLQDGRLLGTLGNRSPREPVLIVVSTAHGWSRLLEVMTTLAFHHGPLVVVPPETQGSERLPQGAQALAEMVRVRVRAGAGDRVVWIIRHARNEVGRLVWGADPRRRLGRAEVPSHLSTAIARPVDAAGSTALDRQRVEQRRAVLLRDPWMRAELGRLAVSLVLVTRRPDFLPGALRQLRQQRGIATELIVVGHGFDPDESLAKVHRAHLWDHAASIPASATLGDGLNLGCRIASAPLVLKVDDDDWYGEHVAVDLAMELLLSGAEVVGKAMEFVYLAGLDLTVRRKAPTERYGEHISGATMLIRQTDLWELGGWAAVARAVDSRLLDSVRRAGASYFATNGFGYMVHRHGADNTFKVPDAWFLDDAVGQWLGCATDVAGVAEPAGEVSRGG